jgi:SAM-dependent methyltransferase
MTTSSQWVHETRFGSWFLRTNMWSQFVLGAAVDDLSRLRGEAVARVRALLDVGCGPGRAFALLEQRFQPERIIGVDIDPAELAHARAAADLCRCQVELRAGDAARLPLEDGSVDLVFCHQTLHHVSHPPAVLRELYRVLEPGGTLLLSESCRPFLRSLPVRALFRHPPHMAATAEQFLTLVRRAGFEVDERRVAKPRPFWAQPDFGLRERLGRPPRGGEPLQLELAARRPA